MAGTALQCVCASRILNQIPFVLVVSDVLVRRRWKLMERARKGCGRGCASLAPPLLPSRGCGVVLIITFHFELDFFLPLENTPYRGDVAFSDGSEM